MILNWQIFFRTLVSPNFPEDSDILTNYFHPPLISVTIFCPKFQPEVMGRKVENHRLIGWSEEKEPAKQTTSGQRGKNQETIQFNQLLKEVGGGGQQSQVLQIGSVI